MVQALQLDDPIVSVEDIKELKLAFLMQFFVQHKQRFRFPRLRLQDLYQHILKGSETVPLCDCVVRILRFLRHRDPTVCIASVDEALDSFVVEKRTTHRQALQAARAGRSVSELDPPARALLLEHLIECVYDERPELSFNAVLNAPKESTERDVGVLPSPDDESLLIKAGQDASGSSYYYMDDLRLYRETPQGGLSSHWSVAVGPTIQQWTSFIASLGRAGEEAELCHFLKKELFSYVQECIENPYMNDFADELNSSRLLDKEAAELAEIRQQRGLPTVSTSFAPNKSSTPPTPQITAPLATEGGSGCSAASSSGNSTSTCPLTPPNGTPSMLHASQPAAPVPESSGAPAKASLTAPNTPSTAVWILDGGQPSSTAITRCATAATRCQYPNSVGSPRSDYVPCSSSPSQQDAKATNGPSSGRQQQPLDSPLRRPASGPVPAEAVTQADGSQPHSAPPFSAPSSVGDGSRRTSMTSNHAFSVSGQKLEPDSQVRDVYLHIPLVPEGMVDPGPRPNVVMSSSTAHGDAASFRSMTAVSSPFPVGPFVLPSHALVFTTEMANEAAVKCQRTRMRITTFHSMHPLVQQYMLQSGLLSSATTSAIGSSAVDCVVTQEQLENRKSKMAQLEKIHSKLTKSKMASTPGAATVAAMQQQQMYAAAAASGDGQIPQPLPPPASAIPPVPHDPVHPSPHPVGSLGTDVNQQSRGMMVGRPEEREFDRMSWMQHQRKHSATVGDPNGVSFQYSGPMDQTGVPPPGTGGPPVLVVPPNNACGYHPQPNKFCIPAPPPPPYKRPYPPEMAPPEQQFWDQQQAMFEQHQQQQAMMLQQQQVINSTSGNCGRPPSSRGGLSKKRKSASGTNSRSSSARPPQPPSMSTFGGPQRISQPPTSVGVIKSGGFGSLPIGPPRGSVTCSSYQALPSDPVNSAYANPNYRASTICAGNTTMMEQPQFSPIHSGPAAVPLPPTSSQQQPPVGGYTHSADAIPGSSSTQHLTSASLASLARLSQLSGSEGPFCPPPSLPSSASNNSPAACPLPPPPSGYSRMASVPDMLPFSGGTGPAMIPNPDSETGSLYSMSSASNPSGAAGGPPYQAIPISQCGQQQHFSTGPSGQLLGGGRLSDRLQPSNSCGSFAPSDQSRSVAELSSSSTARCITPSSAPPICPTSASPTTPTTTNSVPPLPPSSTASQPSSQQQQLQPPTQPVQVSNTFFNAQLNVQQMHYQHINGGGNSSQMQIHFMQQQQQRPYYSGNGCPMSQAPPANQRMESRTQPPTNVQITPKTPHTIQYLPTSSTSIPTSSAVVPSTAAAPTNTTNTAGGLYSTQINLSGSGKPRMPQPTASAVASPASRLQSPTHSQVVPNAVATNNVVPSANPPASCVATAASTIPEQRTTTIPSRHQPQRGQKIEPSQPPPAQLSLTPTTQSSIPTSGDSAVSSADIAPLSDAMYSGSAASSARCPQGFAVSAIDPSQVQQADHTSPFDFAQGVTAYPDSAASATCQPRGSYREQLHIQYSSQSTNSSTSTTYRLDAELPSSVPVPTSSAVTITTAATKGFLPPPSQMYVGDMNYHQHRWQQQQQAPIMGGDFYLPQSQNNSSNSSGVLMMPPPPTPQASQAQQQYYMPPSGAVPSHLHQQLQPQPPQVNHSRAYPALM